MKYTNLEYVQSILSSLGSEEVNSVGDTPESLQVLDVLKTTYFNIISRTHPPDHKQLIQLDASLDVNQPVLMYIPEGIKKLEWLKYFDTSTPPEMYQYVSIVPVTQFLDMVSGFNPDETDVGTFTFTDSSNNYPGTYTFYYKNSRQPQYCTVLSNYYVIFDAYDSSIESTLQSAKTQALGEISPHWSDADDFVPSLDEDQSTLLLNEAKSLAFFELKQTVHTKAEQEAKRQWSSVQRDKSIVDRPSYFDQLPDFGRRGMAPSRTFKDKGWDRV